MRRRSVPFLMILALVWVVSACGDDGGSLFEGTPATGGDTSPAEGTPATGGDVSPFEGAPGTVPESMETIVVEAAGEPWELPAAVCLTADGDADIVLAAAQQEAATLHGLVARQLSGWPTTTAQPPDQQEISARDLRVAGVTALTLAGLAGEQAALEQTWVDYEQGLADPEQGWGPPQVIALQVEEWKSTAATLTEAIAAHCAG